MSDYYDNIACTIFKQCEPGISAVTERINQARDPELKIKAAGDLLKEVQPLLDCADYKSEDAACGSCRILANVRKTTADLIISMKKIM